MDINAIERVADKRHARLMANGKTEAEAARIVAIWLRGLLNRNPSARSDQQNFVENLARGYEQPL